VTDQHETMEQEAIELEADATNFRTQATYLYQAAAQADARARALRRAIRVQRMAEKQKGADNA